MTYITIMVKWSKNKRPWCAMKDFQVKLILYRSNGTNILKLLEFTIYRTKNLPLFGKFFHTP